MMSTQSNSKGIAVVTGSAQGIGCSIAIRLAEDGYDIVINELESKKEILEEVKKEITANFLECRVLAVLGDVSIKEGVKGLIGSAIKEFGSLNVFVANAGICQSKSFLETTSDDFESVFSVNIKGTFYSHKYAAQQMIAQGKGGRIIGASSIAGKKGFASLGAYCASKFAVRGLTQSASSELGRNGITVNAYAPGIIKMPMGNCYLSSVGDVGTTQDVSNLVSFLVIPEARFITGQTVSIISLLLRDTI
ncbi:hypothetical protein BD769DRAFT_1701401 [Suillus cothurnatus]|nr:hypothetical protein BD769DRAFT_1701401 [Suillus cothurnatus]